MIDGALNFRDLGGLTSRDGRRVRPGRVFRCGGLDGVSDMGLEELSRLGLKLFLDLRSNEERRARPPRLPAPIGLLSRDHDRLTGALYHELDKVADGAGLARQRMLAVYDELPYVHAESYRLLFSALLEGGGPLAFGCAAGKDRTGVGALLVLTALDVPPDEIARDYLESDRHFEALTQRFFSGGRAAIRPADRSRWEPVLRTDAAYLVAAQASICARSGSIERYLAQELGVGAAQLAALRSSLLD